MLQPPRKLTKTAENPTPIAPWLKSSSPVTPNKPDHTNQSIDLNSSSIVYDSPNHFHERDAPAARPAEAWRHTTIRSSVEAEGTKVSDISQPKFLPNKDFQATTNEGNNDSGGGGGTIQSNGMFKVFRPHDQSEWWKSDGRKNITSTMPLDKDFTTLSTTRDPVDIVAARLPFTAGTEGSSGRKELLRGVLGQYEQITAANGLEDHKIRVEAPEARKSIVFGGHNNTSASSRIGISALAVPHVGKGNGLNTSLSTPEPRHERRHVMLREEIDKDYEKADLNFAALSKELEKAKNQVEVLEQQLAQTKRQLVGATHIADKYERMLGPLDHFTAQQVQLREELVKLRDEVVRLLEKDAHSQDRIAHLEASLRRAGYGSLTAASQNNKISPATSSPSNPLNNSKAIPSSANKAFIFESQQRLDELQARLQRALTVRSQIALQLVDAERLTETYRNADDAMSPEKSAQRNDQSHDFLDTSADTKSSIQKITLFDTTNQHVWQMRGRRAELELKLRTQQDLIVAINKAIEVQRETLENEQKKPISEVMEKGSASPVRDPSAQTRPASPNNGSSPKKERILPESQKDVASLRASVKPGAEAEIQNLLAVVNTKNEQIVQLRKLLMAVSQSGRVGLANPGPQPTFTADTTPAKVAESSTPLRSLQVTDVHGQLLQLASTQLDAKDGIHYMTNSDGERARPDDILYPHQRTTPAAEGNEGALDPIAVADQLWKLETENATLNKRCTDLVLQVLEKSSRIKELEGLIIGT